MQKEKFFTYTIEQFTARDREEVAAQVMEEIEATIQQLKRDVIDNRMSLIEAIEIGDDICQHIYKKKLVEKIIARIVATDEFEKQLGIEN